MATRVSAAQYARQRDETTRQELEALQADPAFEAWQLSKARTQARARNRANLAATAGCVLLALTLMALKPAATGPAPPPPLQVSRRPPPRLCTCPPIGRVCLHRTLSASPLTSS